MTGRVREHDDRWIDWNGRGRREGVGPFSELKGLVGNLAADNAIFRIL